MKLFEINPGITSDNNIVLYKKISDEFKRLGFHLVGEGSFAVVFSKNEIDYVYKVFRNDRKYYKFVKYCMKNQNNEHLPKILDFKTINSDIHIVKLEKLNDMVETFKNIVSIDRIIEKNPSVKKTYEDIKNIFGENSLDITNNNVMFRNKVLVFTDPVSSSNETI